MDDYMRIAAKTPFELNEVVEAGNKLQALGRYSEDTLKMLGDLAAVSGKPFEQVMNAYANMATGQRGESVRMFRDLLISGDDWIKATGKQLDDMTTLEMEKVLPEIMKSKGFFGLMAQQAETTKGKISNLNDALFQLKAAIGERMQPAQKSFVSGLTNIVEKMKSWFAIPVEDKLRGEISHIKVLHDELTDVNTAEDRRIQLLEELNRIDPTLTENINAQAINYGKLADNVDRVVSGLQKQIFWKQADKKIAEHELEYENYADRIGEAQYSIRELYTSYGIDKGSFKENISAVEALLLNKINEQNKRAKGSQTTRTKEAQQLADLNLSRAVINELTPKKEEQDALIKKIRKDYEGLAVELGMENTRAQQLDASSKWFIGPLPATGMNTTTTNNNSDDTVN
ncbi:MAG: hypothetical protein R2764_01575 [Bacteroidales bacterium]